MIFYREKCKNGRLLEGLRRCWGLDLSMEYFVDILQWKLQKR